MAVRYKLAGAPEVKTYLQEWRETKFSTQQALSNVIGLPAPTISRYETGEREWGKGYLEALAHAVGCRVLDLFSSPHASQEDKLRVALLAYGVDRDDLAPVMKAINGFVADRPDDELSRLGPSPVRTGPANPRHESEPSQRQSQRSASLPSSQDR